MWNKRKQNQFYAESRSVLVSVPKGSSCSHSLRLLWEVPVFGIAADTALGAPQTFLLGRFADPWLLGSSQLDLRL